MSNLVELLQLAQNTQPRMRTTRPYSKRFKKWNRRMIREGRATFHITHFYHPLEDTTGQGMSGFRKKRYDRRYREERLIKAQRLIFGEGTGPGVFAPPAAVPSRYEIPPQQAINDDDWRLLRDLAGDRTGRWRIVIRQGNNIFHDGIHLLNEGWWGREGHKFIVDESPQFPVWIAAPDINGPPVTFIFSRLLRLPAQYFEQAFAEGAVHCVFGEIVKWAQKEIEKKNERNVLPLLFGEPLIQTKKEKALVSKIMGRQFKKHRRKGYIDDYPAGKGIKENNLQSVCDALGIGIKIFQPFAPKIAIDLRCAEKPIKVFRFLNSKYNHLSVPTWFPSVNSSSQTIQFTINSLFLDEAKGIEKTRDELHELTLEDETWFDKDHFGVCRVKTNDAVYHLPDKFMEIKNAFEKEYNFRDYKIEEAKNPDVAHFVNEGTHWNGTRNFVAVLPKATDPNLTHIDQKAAYTKFKESRYYCGFVGHFSNYRQIAKGFDWENHNGLYEITNINFDKCSYKFKKAINKLGWFHNDIPYWKSELLMLKHHKVTFEITKGLIGPTFNFEFPESMFEKQKVRCGDKVVEIPFYAKWCGMQASTSRTRRIYTRGRDEKYMKTLQKSFQQHNTKNGTTIFYYKKGDEYVLETPKKVVSRQHIAGQITAYQRLGMFEQLMKMDIDKIVRVCVDGIYFWKHEVELINGFRYKTEKMNFKNTECNDYLSGVFEKARPPKLSYGGAGLPMDFVQKTLKKGAGGTGKTYGVLKDKGFVKVLYVAPSHKLAAKMKKDFPDRDVSVTARLLSPALKYRHLRNYPVYCIDEASMIVEAFKWLIFEINPEAQFIFCGDLGYQLQPVIDETMKEKYTASQLKQMDESGFEKIETLTKNYRNGGDKKLTKILNGLRKMMDKIKGCTSQYLARHCVKEFFQKDFPYKHFQVLKSGLEGAYNPKKIKWKQGKKLATLKSFGYEKEDLIICSEGGKNNKNPKAMCNIYTEKFKEIKKCQVLENKKGFCNGQIVFTKPKGVRSQLRHGYTIHSIQGETADHKLFIDMTKMKSLQMFYTALSRARKINQIYLMKP